MADLENLDFELGSHGLCLRGVLVRDSQGRFTAGAGAASGNPRPGEDGVRNGFLCLVGYFGGAMWPHLEPWMRARPELRDPLDAWSKAVIAPIARDAGGEAVFPSDRPWRPFQQWAMAAENLAPSPLGMLIHPEFGLWHGYRGAILFGQSEASQTDPTGVSSLRPSTAVMRAGGDVAARHPCVTCRDKPCLSACPVAAFKNEGFDVAACRGHLRTDEGVQGCMSAGCRARDACPVGRRHRYSDAQIRFHMAAFRPD